MKFSVNYYEFWDFNTPFIDPPFNRYLCHIWSWVGWETWGWSPDPPSCFSDLGVVTGHWLHQEAGPLMHRLKVKRGGACPTIVGTRLCGETYREKLSLAAPYLWKIHPSFFHENRIGPAWWPAHPPHTYRVGPGRQPGEGGRGRAAALPPPGRGLPGPAQPAQVPFWYCAAGLSRLCLSIHTWVSTFNIFSSSSWSCFSQCCRQFSQNLPEADSV